MARVPSQLSKKKIDKLMRGLPEWRLDKAYKKITITHTFENHVEALVFIARVTVHAEVLQHHPEILYTHSKVKITLTTRSVKALTKIDFALAERIDRLYDSG